MPRKGPLYPHVPKGNRQEADIEIERYHGIIVGVGGIKTKTPNLPDWDLSYVEYPPGEMEVYRNALQHERVRIAKVTKQRIYFEER